MISLAEYDMELRAKEKPIFQILKENGNIKHMRQGADVDILANDKGCGIRSALPLSLSRRS
jgi:hypothetical protein